MSGVGEGIVLKMAAGNIVWTTAWIKMTGYNVKLSFFGFKLIELTPKLIKYGIKVSGKFLREFGWLLQG